MKKFYLLGMVFCILLGVCGCGSSSEPRRQVISALENTGSEPETTAVSGGELTEELSERERNWIEDIEYLREEYKTKHIEPFCLCSEEEFDWKLDQLAAKVGELSDNDIFFELNTVIAGMGDNHTQILWDRDSISALSIYDRLFPIRFNFFGGRMYLTGCHENYEELTPYLLHEIVAVNGVDITYVLHKAVSFDMPSNIWSGQAKIFFAPSLFDWAGCDYVDGYTFQILNDNQEVESVDIPVITRSEWEEGEWIRPENWDSLLYQRGRNLSAYLDGNDGGCIYMSLVELDYPSSTRRLMAETGKLAEAHPECSKLAVDLRMNSGGYLHIVEEVQKEAHVLEGKQIYVLTGGMTASAALTFISYFKDTFDAVVVGEPTSQFPSFFYVSEQRESEPSVLPHSGIKVQIADNWLDSATDLPKRNITPVFEEYYDENDRLYEWENTILPDVFVYQDIEDIRQGKDSVIEWVIRQ